jgi:hypothetical protein
MKPLCLLGALTFTACASAPAAPFDTLQNANVVAYRLQNYEHPPTPAAAAPAAPAAPGLPAIPGLPPIPPEIQQWAQQALPGLQQMIPPGILPPGLIPGAPAAPAPAPVAQPQAPRFHGFRILEQQPLVSPDLKETLAELLGDEDSFQTPSSNCMYAEMGLSFGNGNGAPTNDVLVSFSCNQMQGHNFIWPHPSAGMTSDTVKALADVVAKIFPASGGAPAPQAVAVR